MSPDEKAMARLRMHECGLFLDNFDAVDYLNIQYAIHRGVRSMGKSIMEYPDLLDLRDYDGRNAEMGPEEGEEKPGAATAEPEEVEDGPGAATAGPEEVEDGPGAANGAPDVSADDAELEEDPYYRMPAEDKLSLEAAAVHMRYLMEQAERDDYADKLFEKAMMKGMSRKERKRLKRQMWEAEKLSAGADTDNEAADSQEDGIQVAAIVSIPPGRFESDGEQCKHQSTSSNAAGMAYHFLLGEQSEKDHRSDGENWRCKLQAVSGDR